MGRARSQACEGLAPVCFLRVVKGNEWDPRMKFAVILINAVKQHEIQG